MISVIVPIYNVEAYLEKCLKSILDNTYRDLEVICIDDGSPDNCLSILQKFANEDARIRIVDQKNQGVQAARNKGLSLATGDYIAFVDPDDWIHPQYFQSLFDCIEQYDADIAICGCQTVREGEDIATEEYDSINFRKLSDTAFFQSYYARHMCWARLYRRSAIEGIRFVPEVKLGDDTLFNLQVISKLKDPKVYETETRMYYYLQRSGSIVRTSKYHDYIVFPEWVFKNVSYDNGFIWSWMILMQSIKFALSYRYEAALRKDQENFAHVNGILRDFSRNLWKDRHIDSKEKAIHFAMIACPWLYRYFRIKDDPSLLEWEKKIRTEADRK